MIERGVEEALVELVLVFFLTGEWLGEGRFVPRLLSEIDRFVMWVLRSGSIGSGAVGIGRGGSSSRVMSTIPTSGVVVLVRGIMALVSPPSGAMSVGVSSPDMGFVTLAIATGGGVSLGCSIWRMGCSCAVVSAVGAGAPFAVAS